MLCEVFWHSDGRVVMQFECGTRILRVSHGRDTGATLSNCTTTDRRCGLRLSVKCDNISRR